MIDLNFQTEQQAILQQQLADSTTNEENSVGTLNSKLNDIEKNMKKKLKELEQKNKEINKALTKMEETQKELDNRLKNLESQKNKS